VLDIQFGGNGHRGLKMRAMAQFTVFFILQQVC
jgi:hypothetical protein